MVLADQRSPLSGEFSKGLYPVLFIGLQTGIESALQQAHPRREQHFWQDRIGVPSVNRWYIDFAGAKDAPIGLVKSAYDNSPSARTLFAVGLEEDATIVIVRRYIKESHQLGFQLFKTPPGVSDLAAVIKGAVSSFLSFERSSDRFLSLAANYEDTLSRVIYDKYQPLFT